MTIEGIPDGWELVAFRRAVSGDYFLNARGLPEPWTLNVSSSGIYPIIRKIEKPKRYRPFANAAEFLSHPLNSDFIDLGACEFAKVQQCNDMGIWLVNMDEMYFYEDAFVDLQFRNGTPFGIDVTE